MMFPPFSASLYFSGAAYVPVVVVSAASEKEMKPAITRGM